MTQLYLIRHGIAAERGTYNNDELRPLTKKGQQKTHNIAQRLQEIGIKFDIILTSPLVRAHQTAKILQEMGLSQQIQMMPCLSPQGKLEDWVNWWSNSRYNREESCLALVGHQPNLGQWSERLIWGQSQDKLVVKKAGLIGLTLSNCSNPIGESELNLLIPPRWLL
ncbi:MAG: phosphohistidine phosphatase SixA [Microcystaceae cyanobacterium]